jgi:hypothetical protein
MVFLSTPIIQIALLQILTLASALLTAHMRVYTRPFTRHHSMFNECCMMCIIYCLLGFTPWIDDSEIRVNIGWVTIGIICLWLSTSMFVELEKSTQFIKGKCIL